MMEKSDYLFVSKDRERNLEMVFIGSLLMVFCSCIKIPFYPVSFTLQTLGIYILGLFQPPRIACGSVLIFLLYASLGLPVFGGHANPLWLIGKASGYLAAFPVAAFGIAWMRQRRSSLIALICGTALILGCGFIGLVPFVGWKIALINGILLFIPSSLLKIIAARKMVP